VALPDQDMALDGDDDEGEDGGDSDEDESSEGEEGDGAVEGNGVVDEDDDVDEEGDTEYLRRLARESARMKARGVPSHPWPPPLLRPEVCWQACACCLQGAWRSLHPDSGGSSAWHGVCHGACRDDTPMPGSGDPLMGVRAQTCSCAAHMTRDSPPIAPVMTPPGMLAGMRMLPAKRA
jgi:hypothetical protein